MKVTTIRHKQHVESLGQVRQRNEQAILDSAEIEFAQYGFEGGTIKNIAERIDLPKANIHYYFRSKLDLYKAVLNNVLVMWDSAFDGVDIHTDPAQALEAYIRAKVEFSKKHARASRIFACEIISGAPYLSHYLKDDLQSWVSQKCQVVQHWIDEKKMLPLNPIHLFITIWGATQYLGDFQTQVESALNTSPLEDQDYEALADSLVKLILGGCGLNGR